ncbi:DUF4190 domain-containing protein [Streptomyces murinus]|uniref:DUF4190 domain-containing protein n=1 Tax=Streptomyces murinus TaxID=33900 RepID=A0A7W3NR80_STRMR|nr:DUF4190 domain-containing protein [Streptomyces murinus]MBA9055219.1 hypothetical protein [Streptomyces murinus]
MNAQGIETHHMASTRTDAVGTRLTTPRNGLATAALTLGVTGLLTSVVFVGGPLAVIGLILGIAALMTARRTGAGRGKAVTALVASALAIVVSGLVAVLVLWYADQTQECYRPDSFHQYTQCVRLHLDGDRPASSHR